MTEAKTPLPIDPLLPEIVESLGESPRLVVQAAPGAGKSTRVPGALLEAPWMDGRRVLLLEPRRIAARNLAVFLAAEAGERVGQSVGLQIRLERRMSQQTRLEVLTEGVLTRRLQSDPELAGVGAIVFDEFHERHIASDLGLALALEVQRSLRPDLRIVVMSATLDGQAISKWMEAPLLEAPGRQHSLTIDHQPCKERRASPAELARAAADASARQDGDLLIFVPGAAEVRATVTRLGHSLPELEVQPLYGELQLEDQRKALEPCEGRRAVVATNIAESSLTVPGVQIVIDSGLARVPRFDPESGLTRLETRRVSRASADQRAGRAARLGPGLCLRLWSREERLDPELQPEILHADLAPLAMELALWGADDSALPWLDTPPTGALAQARDLLEMLGLLDRQGRPTAQPTALGRRIGSHGTHPRLAAMLEQAGELRPLACDLAALLEGRDPLPPEERDDRIDVRLDALHAWRRGDRRERSLAAADRLARRWMPKGKSLDAREDATADIGQLLILAYPDRIAQLRLGSERRYRLAGGGGARLNEDSALAGQPWLVAAGVRHAQPDRWVSLAAPVEWDAVQALVEGRDEWQDEASWDTTRDAVTARRVRRFGALVLESKPWLNVPPETIAGVLTDQVRRRGLGMLDWSRTSLRLRERMAFARQAQPDGPWPDWSDGHLLETLEDWLTPHLIGADRLSQISGLDLDDVLYGSLEWSVRMKLDEFAPENMVIPSGREARIDYANPTAPVLAVKLQEMFGLNDTPRIAGGRVPLTVHLLSPAGRPLQITQDLAHFWAHGYAEVRKEMRGRYPKHPWPEDPRMARPTAGTKRNSP